MWVTMVVIIMNQLLFYTGWVCFGPTFDELLQSIGRWLLSCEAIWSSHDTWRHHYINYYKKWVGLPSCRTRQPYHIPATTKYLEISLHRPWMPKYVCVQGDGKDPNCWKRVRKSNQVNFWTWLEQSPLLLEQILHQLTFYLSLHAHFIIHLFILTFICHNIIIMSQDSSVCSKFRGRIDISYCSIKSVSS